eukprot:TRINITY_DN7749_c0_g1_i1.p1 TRINITY_DN7749_c0_g1~~TRINITY_DN7749_c0_g1_i1.p1  ORF type:complete len:172 (-),score=38.28 TRINITY_DN7749_c0_g1_i1:250-765(-)
MEQQQRLKIESMEALLEETTKKIEDTDSNLRRLEVHNKELNDLAMKKQQENDQLRKRLNEKLTIIDQLKRKLQILNKPSNSFASKSSKENGTSQVKNTSTDIPETGESNENSTSRNNVLFKEVANAAYNASKTGVSAKKKHVAGKATEQLRGRSNSNGSFECDAYSCRKEQ